MARTKKVKEFHPWNSEEQVSEFIGSLIKLHGCEKVLEIGVFQGQTGLAMIEASKDYTGIDITDSNFSDEYKEKAYYIVGSSFEVLPNLDKKTFDLIFIDSVHEYEHLKKEFALCEKLIKQGGLIVLHDSLLFKGVKQFVTELRENKGFEVITFNTPDIEGRGGASGLSVIKYLYA